MSPKTKHKIKTSMGLITSILTLRCPRCRKGKLFTQPFNYTNAFSMPKQCPECNLVYIREPGFFYGAMFISYGITAWLFFVIGMIMTFGFGIDFNTALVVILIVAVLLFVYSFRVARSVWIHIFVKYDPEILKSNG